MNLGGYPMGAQYDPNAPFNQEKPQEEEITATVSITLSKTIQLFTSQYTKEYLGKDENGIPEFSYKFDNAEILQQIKSVVEKELHIDTSWNIDEFEVIPEDYEVF